MSYRKRQISGRIKTLRPRKPIYKKIWFGAAVLVVIFLALLAYFFVFYPGVQITEVIISGNQKVSARSIENFSDKVIRKKIVSIGNWDLTTRSIFLLNSNELASYLADEFPNISEVKVNKRFFQTLLVYIQERVPSAILCSLIDRENCYLVDNMGVMFEPAEYAPETIPVILQSLEGLEFFVGKEVVSEKAINVILEIKRALGDNFQIGLVEVLISGPTRLNITTDEDWKIYFDLGTKADTNSQINKLYLLLNKEISEDKRGKLHYIDLRPDDRAIVCDNDICANQ